MLHPAGAGRGSQVEKATGDRVAVWGAGSGQRRGLCRGLCRDLCRDLFAGLAGTAAN